MSNHARSLKPVAKIWLDGKLVDWNAASIHILTHSLHYGVAAFEGIRCYRREGGRSAVFRLGDHIDRLLDSCRITTLDSPYSKAEIERFCLDTIRSNNMVQAYLRPIIFL